MQADRHEWACFAAHQATEKALKALNLALGQQAWGHTLTRLWAAVPGKADLQPPYPEGTPSEHFGRLQSEQGLFHATTIIEWVRAAMAQLGPRP